MTPEQFRRLDELFNQVRDLSPDHQAECIDTLREDDPQLADFLQQMLRNTDQDPALAVLDQARTSATQDDSTIGEMLGPWQVIEIIGRGGMGAVYRATREFEGLTQQVAIKKIRLGMDDPLVRSRFLRERQILAKLDHPGLARLIDGGTDARGTPYVVMDYVDGQPITRYCQDHGLSVPQRLALFIDLCRTVHFVHRNLIVHRDIKPANVMVNREGAVKLLDFGIAKLLDPEESDHTATAQQALTPEYASPEQLLGDTVSTASDVFSLGALLYELLTGHLIIDDHSSDSRRGSRLIQQRLPTLPSHQVTNRDRTGPRLSHQIGNDLDRIVMMALRTEPQRRYASAEALAEDLERYLKQRPVQAQSDSLRYRSGKFIRRNRWAVAAFSLAFFSALLFAAISVYQAQRVASERDRALQAEQDALHEATTAREISQFMIGLFQASNPREAGNQFLSARDLLDGGLAQLKLPPGDDNPISVSDPAVRAELFLAIGLAYTALDISDPAVDAMALALAETERAYGSEHIRTAEIYNRYGDVLREADRADEAEPWLMKSLQMKRRLLGEESREVADSYNNIGIMLVDQHRLDEALEFQRKSVETWRRAVGPDSVRMSIPTYNLGLLYRRLGRFEDAMQAANEAQRTNLDRPDLDAKIDMLRARLHRQLGQSERALPLFERALEWAVTSYGAYQGMALTIGREIAITQGVLGRYQEALSMLERLETDARRDPIDWFYWQYNRGVILSQQTRYDQAIADLNEALIWLLDSNSRPYLLPPLRFHLARSLLATGQLDQAHVQIQSGLTLSLEDSALRSHAPGLLLLEARRQLLIDPDQDVLPLIEQADQQRRASRADDSPEAADVWLWSSQLHELSGHHDTQHSTAERALAELRRQLPDDHWKVTEARRLLNASD